MTAVVGGGERCGVAHGKDVTLRCPIAAPRRYRTTIFTNGQRRSTYRQAATLDVIRR